MASDTAAAAKLPDGVTLLKTLTGHSGYVSGVAFDASGGRLASASADSTVKLWEVDSGRLIHSLEGPSRIVFGVAFDASGGRLASASADHTIKLWDTDSGRLIHSLNGHIDVLRGVALDASGGRLASASRDNTMKLWDADSGRLIHSLNGHSNTVMSVAFDASGGRVASGSTDKTVMLWEADSGRLIHSLDGHSGNVYGVAIDTTTDQLASASLDNTVKLWDLDSGRLLRTLEGHTGEVHAVAFSPDGRLLASKGGDTTIRIWNCATWETVAVVPTVMSSWQERPLAFHPDPGVHRAVLATHGKTNKDDIVLWELDLNVLLGAAGGVANVSAEERTVGHVTAKVVLVGDTGVGKSSLADRLVTGDFVQNPSTHARRTLTLDSDEVEVAAGDDATRTEMHDTILWDLAGQPAYRLVNQLSLDDAAVACVLFDSRSEQTPFEPAEYWAKVLNQTRTRVPLTKILVASRVDVGGLPTGLDRIKAFAQEHGFDGFIRTSAETGEGCDELLEKIRTSIPWDQLPAVSSSLLLQELRKYVRQPVAELVKSFGTNREDGQESAEKRDRSKALTASATELIRVDELHTKFQEHTCHEISFEHFVAYLQRLEDTGSVDVLNFRTSDPAPRAEDKVLLDPTRTDAYASAVLVTARDEPDGPGHLSEARISAGEFDLAESERLASKEDEAHLLWYVMETLFVRDLGLREKINDEDYVVFPAQCTSDMPYPGGTQFGVAYGMSGPVRAIYATLIAQLAHYHGFTKREFFQDAAAYHTKQGHRCLIRLADRGDGSGELLLSFDRSLAPRVRAGFLDFVAGHVKAKANPESFATRHAYICEDCQHEFDDDVVRKRLKMKLKDLLCPVCESRSPLVDLMAEPNKAAHKVSADMKDDAVVGRKRITAAWVIKGKEAQGRYDVFLSHNSKDKREVEAIAKALKKKGIRPWFDKWDLAPGDIINDKLEWAIEHVPCAALFFGEHDAGNWHIMEYRAYLERWAQGKARMVPVILPGAPDKPDLPVFLRQALWVDMQEWKSKGSDAFYRLQCGILDRAPGDGSRKPMSPREVLEWQDDNGEPT